MSSEKWFPGRRGGGIEVGGVGGGGGVEDKQVSNVWEVIMTNRHHQISNQKKASQSYGQYDTI